MIRCDNVVGFRFIEIYNGKEDVWKGWYNVFIDKGEKKGTEEYANQTYIGLFRPEAAKDLMRISENNFTDCTEGFAESDSSASAKIGEALECIENFIHLHKATMRQFLSPRVQVSEVVEELTKIKSILKPDKGESDV